MNDDEFLNDRDCTPTPKGETPRTDAATRRIDYVGAPTLFYVPADFARELEQKLRECRNAFAALRFAVVGATARDAVTEAHRLRAENDRLHKAQFELARALRVVDAAVAMQQDTRSYTKSVLLEKAIYEWEAGR